MLYWLVGRQQHQKSVCFKNRERSAVKKTEDGKQKELD